MAGWTQFLVCSLAGCKEKGGNGWKGSVGLLILGKEGLLEGGRSLAGQMDDWRELAGVADRKRLLLKPYGPG